MEDGMELEMQNFSIDFFAFIYGHGHIDMSSAQNNYSHFIFAIAVIINTMHRNSVQKYIHV